MEKLTWNDGFCDEINANIQKSWGCDAKQTDEKKLC